MRNIGRLQTKKTQVEVKEAQKRQERDMRRHAFAVQIKQGCFSAYRKALGEIWSELTQLLDEMQVQNFSLWNAENLVFGYCELPDKLSISQEMQQKLDALEQEVGDTYTWISVPGESMRLMYEDFGVVRSNKELIRHRVFMTRLKPGKQEEYKRRHDALAEQRCGKINPGPDSNFSIWNAGDYIFGYDEIDITMEQEETEEDRENSKIWETYMLEIMSWITDDVDWLTGMHHKHIQRIGFHR